MDTASPPRLEPDRGVYPAKRAAALAGVPLSTLHYWARTGLYAPSIAVGPRDRLWSWGDLLALRAIDWLRQGQQDVALRASIPRIRRLLAELDQRGISRDQLLDIVAVARNGELYFDLEENVVRALSGGQAAIPDIIELVRPYHAGPDLLTPRPLLRILPGKVHGEPHVVNTRIPSAAIFALAQRGYELPLIRQMYPEATEQAILQAIDLERSLAHPAA